MTDWEIQETGSTAAEKTVKKRKPPPEFYTCKACGVGKHWIFECDVYKEQKKLKQERPNVTEVLQLKNGNSRKRMRTKPTEVDSSKEDFDCSKCDVYVNGLPYDISTTEIRKIFEPCGEIVKLSVPKFTDSKRCKGIAFISFKSEGMALKSLAMDGTTLDNSKRYLNICLQKQKVEKLDGAAKPMSPCYRCGSRKHLPSQCKNRKICYRCKSTEHLSFDCPKKKQTKVA